MANKHSNLSELFTAIANAIRVADDNITGPLVADDFPDIIANIESGIDTTLGAEGAGPNDIVSGKRAYVNGLLVEGLLSPNASDIKTGATIAGVTGTFTKVDSNAAAAANIETGKIAFVNGSQIKGNLPNNVTTLTFSAATNNTSSSAIAIQSKHSSKFICNANTNMTTSVPYSNIVSAIGLTASQIVTGQTVLGVAGSFSAEASKPITASSVLSGYVGYVNGAKVTGSMGNATLKTPTLTANNATTGTVTINYGVSTAGYAATSSPTTTATIPFTIHSSVSGTTDLGSAGGSKTFAAGYYPYSHGVSATAGMQIAEGDIDPSSYTITVNTSFTPKGFFMIPYSSGSYNEFDKWCTMAIRCNTGETEARVYYTYHNSVETITEEAYTIQSIAICNIFHSAYTTGFIDHPSNHEDDGGYVVVDTRNGDTLLDNGDWQSVIDPYIKNAASYYATSYNYLNETGWVKYVSTIENPGGTYTVITGPDCDFEDCAVTFSSTGLTFTLGDAEPTRLRYVVWG